MSLFTLAWYTCLKSSTPPSLAEILAPRTLPLVSTDLCQTFDLIKVSENLPSLQLSDNL